MQVDITTAAPPLQATCAECGYPFYPGADLCQSCGLADDLRIARYASVAGCACAATHWLNRNGRGVDYHGCQRGGVVTQQRRRERVRERNAEWAALHREGLSMRQIAALWGKAPSTVSRALREALKRPEDPVEGGEGGNAPPAHAHTRSAPPPITSGPFSVGSIGSLGLGAYAASPPAYQRRHPWRSLPGAPRPAPRGPPAPRCTPVRPRPRLGPPVGNGRGAARLQGRARHLVESKTTRGLWVIPPVWAKLWEIRVRLALQQK